MSFKNSWVKIGFGVFIVLLGVAYWYFSGLPEAGVISTEATLREVIMSNEPTGRAYLTVPYLTRIDYWKYANAAIDLNQDGHFAAYAVGEVQQEEWVVKNIQAVVSYEEPNGYSFRLQDPAIREKGNLVVNIMVTAGPVDEWDGQAKRRSAFTTATIVKVEKDDVSDLHELDPQGIRDGGPAEAMSAQEFPAIELSFDTPPVAQETEFPSIDLSFSEGKESAPPAPPSPPPARPKGFNVFRRGVPDITQKRNECVPTSTANSILWLAQEYNFKDKIPASQEALIEELKRDMKWTRYGVDVQADFLTGKRDFFLRYNIPIETHVIGRPFDLEIVPKIAVELEKGQDVEIAIEYGAMDRNGRYQRLGGHMVTVVGAQSIGEDQYLDFHDPLSEDSLVDIYRITGTRVVDYRYQGARSSSYIRYAFAESPVAQAAEDNRQVVASPTPSVSPSPSPSRVAQTPAPKKEAPATTSQVSGISYIEVLELSDGFYPTVQMKLLQPDKTCSKPYYRGLKDTIYGIGFGGSWNVRHDYILRRRSWLVTSYSLMTLCSIGEVGINPKLNIPVNDSEKKMLWEKMTVK